MNKTPKRSESAAKYRQEKQWNRQRFDGWLTGETRFTDQELSAQYERMCDATSEFTKKLIAARQETRVAADALKQQLVREEDIVDLQLSGAWMTRIFFERRYPEVVLQKVREIEEDLELMRDRLRFIADAQVLQARWLALAAENAPLAVMIRFGPDSGRLRAGEEWDTGVRAFRLEGDVLLVQSAESMPARKTLKQVRQEVLRRYCDSETSDTVLLRPVE